MKKKIQSKIFLIKIFLLLVLLFFTLTYSIINKNTIVEQIDIVLEGSKFFAKTTTYKILDLYPKNSGKYNENTYKIELMIFEEINLIRSQNGLNKLKWDPKLSQLAREHSLDMAEKNYFNHTNLEGFNPTERAELLGINTRYETKTKIYNGIGENIGFMPKGIVKDVGVIITNRDIASGMVYKWMLSQPHKKNILEKDYFFTGIGVSYDGKENYYITQNFQ